MNADRFFMDTAYVLALLNQNDKYHEQAITTPSTHMQALVQEGASAERKQAGRISILLLTADRCRLKAAIKPMRCPPHHTLLLQPMLSVCAPTRRP